MEWDHFLSLAVKDLISEEFLEGENRNILDFFSRFLENSRLWKEQQKQKEESEKKDFTLDFYAGLGIEEEKQEEQDDKQEKQRQTYNTHMSEKFLEPKPFRGTPGEDAREWLGMVESWLSYQNYANLPSLETLTDEEEKKMIKMAIAVARRRVPYALGLLMHGAAAVWFNTLEAADKETFIAFKEKFKERYIENQVNKYSSLVNVWEEKQKPNETVDTYYDSHLKLVKLAGLDADANTNQAFVHGLLPHIKMQVMMQGKVELKEILESARLAEIAYGAAVGKSASQSEASASSATTSKKTKTEVSSVQETGSDGQTVKVLKKLLESVVGATVGKTISPICSQTTSPRGTTPPGTQESIPEVQKIESQLDSDEQWRQGNAQNWIGQSENKQSQPQQQPQQKWQQQQQQSQQQGWQLRQQQPQQQRWQPQQSQPQQRQAQGYQLQQGWQPRQPFQTQRPQQYGQYGQQSGGESCSNCGRYHPPGRANCGMADKTCNNCGKLGHSYRMCRATSGQQQNRQGWQPTSSQGWQPRQQPQEQAGMQSRNPTDTGQR